MGQPLSKAGQLFFVATRLMVAPLAMYGRLRSEMLPKTPYHHQIKDLTSLFDTVMRAGGTLDMMPFQFEADTATYADYIDLVSSMAAVWGAGERLYQLRRIAEGVNQPVFVYNGYLYLVGHILEIYVGIIRSEAINRSRYRDLFADFCVRNDNCIEALSDAIFLTLTDDRTLPNWAHHKLSKETYPLALDWQRTVDELATMPL